MSVRDPATNSYKGYDIDIMTQLAADMGVELEMVPTDWKTLVNGVVAGNYHMTGSASISPARLKAAGYSDSYIAVEMFPFTTEDKAANFDGWDSINKDGVKVATTLGTSFEKMVKEWFPAAEIVVVEAPARGFQEVLSGRADVFVTSNIEGSTLVTKFPNVRQVEVSRTARAYADCDVVAADRSGLDQLRQQLDRTEKDPRFLRRDRTEMGSLSHL